MNALTHLLMHMNDSNKAESVNYWGLDLSESLVLKIIKKRRSIREYSDKEIEKEKLDTILESARHAPSASNSQDWFFYVVKDKETRDKIAASEPVLANQFLHKSPVIIVGCERSLGVVRAATGAVLKAVGTRDRGWGEVNVTIALEHMVLTATELGIGSCWIGLFDGRRISRIQTSLMTRASLRYSHLGTLLLHQRMNP